MNKIKNVGELIVNSFSTIYSALEVINEGGVGICFIEQQGKLVGIATDGDIRRALLDGVGVQEKITLAMRVDFEWLHVDSSIDQINNLLSEKIRVIPLLNDEGKVVDVVTPAQRRRYPIAEPYLNGNEIIYVQDCVRSNWISSQGTYVRKFESIFEDMYPGKKALAVSNGTVALHLALTALGVGSGDEVIVPSLTFAATANSVLHAGAKPVFCEVDKKTWCIDAGEAEKLVNQNTKAIIPVHLYGNACNMEKVAELCKNNNLLMIEDCAEAIGTRWKGKPVGSFGDASTFSFFGNKTITTGEGGMVLFKCSQITEKAKVLRDHGMSRDKKYWHDHIGFNYRLTNLQSAIGVAQLERFDEIIAKKREIGHWYNCYIKRNKYIEMIPVDNRDVFNSYWLYTVILKKPKMRINLVKQLLDLGIETRPVFSPLHKMGVYKIFKHSVDMSTTEKISAAGLSLPSYLCLKEVDIKHIASQLNEILEYEEKHYNV